MFEISEDGMNGKFISIIKRIGTRGFAKLSENPLIANHDAVMFKLDSCSNIGLSSDELMEFLSITSPSQFHAIKTWLKEHGCVYDVRHRENRTKKLLRLTKSGRLYTRYHIRYVIMCLIHYFSFVQDYIQNLHITLLIDEILDRLYGSIDLIDNQEKSIAKVKYEFWKNNSINSLTELGKIISKSEECCDEYIDSVIDIILMFLDQIRYTDVSIETKSKIEYSIDALRDLDSLFSKLRKKEKKNRRYRRLRKIYDEVERGNIRDTLIHRVFNELNTHPEILDSDDFMENFPNCNSRTIKHYRNLFINLTIEKYLIDEVYD